MTFAIIAAGEGSRLYQEGITTPKPLINIGGEPLIKRLIRIFLVQNAQEIVVVCNQQMPEVADYLTQQAQTLWKHHRIKLHVVATQTASSMHSLYEIRHLLKQSPFVLTTVDTVFCEKTFASYIENMQIALQNGADAYMGITPFIDDERPLYIETKAKNEENNQHSIQITGFLDLPTTSCKYISAGIYGFQPKVLNILEQCIEHGEQRMRNFQRALLQNKLNVQGFEFDKVFDVDHTEDIKKANDFVLQNQQNN